MDFLTFSIWYRISKHRWTWPHSELSIVCVWPSTVKGSLLHTPNNFLDASFPSASYYLGSQLWFFKICHVHHLLLYLYRRWSDGNLIFRFILSHAIFLYHLSKVLLLSHTTKLWLFCHIFKCSCAKLISSIWIECFLEEARHHYNGNAFSCEKFLEAWHTNSRMVLFIQYWFEFNAQSPYCQPTLTHTYKMKKCLW